MRLRKLNYRIILISLLLCSVGLIAIYSSSSPAPRLSSPMGWRNNLAIKQIIWILVSITMFFVSFVWGYQRFLDFAPLFYLLSLASLLILLMLGPVISGAQRWFHISGMNFQPSEFAKLSVILFLSRYFITRQDRISRVKTLAGASVFVGIYVFLIFQQPDLGSAIVLIPLFLVMAIFCGMKRRHIIVLLLLGIAFSPLFWSLLKEYQRQRLLVFLDPGRDPLGAGYTIVQSKIAIGSGGLFGKGWFKGSQSQFNFLPESHTDFIFALLCEEWGFLGAVLVLSLYYFLLKTILRTAVLTNDRGAKMLSIAVATFIFSHVFINIGMTLGILPVVGIPLPFISYGGSNLMVNMIALGIVASVKKER